MLRAGSAHRLRESPEYAVPNQIRDGKPGARIFEVVEQVIFSQAAPVCAVWRGVMQPIVSQVVEQVARDEAGVERPAEATQNEPKQHQERKVQGNTRSGWHDEPEAIARPFVVYAVQQKVNPLAPRRLAMPVEDHAM